MLSWNLARARIGIALLIPVLVGAALGVGWVKNQRDEARVRVDSSVRATVATDVTIVRTDLRNQLAAAAAAVQPGDSSFAAASIDRAPVSRDIAFMARDSGAATLDDTARPPSIVAPIYRDHETAPLTTEGRRKAIVSYRIVPLNMQPVLSQLAPERGGLTVHGPTHRIASYPKPAPAGSRTYTVDMDITGSPGWVVQAWQPAPPVPASAWFVGVGLLLLGAAAGGAMAWLTRRNSELTNREWLLEKDRATVTGLATLLQTSLDVGQTFPTAAAHLADHLALLGVSMSAPDEGGERPLFVWGQVPDAQVAPLAQPPTTLESGETYAIALTRGGRAFGVLRIVAGVPLGPYRLQALRTAGDLLGATMANADAFARQQELLDRMRAVDELKTVFLATASHELRTPVTAIVGFSSLLSEQWQSMPQERTRILIDRLRSNGHRLNALIEQLLDFSQLERGLPLADNELLGLGTTVQRLLADRTEFTAAHDLQIVVADDCLVRGSTSAIERIVTNLVGNAAKYSPDGTRITVTVDRSGDTAVLLVDDEGPGVPENDREHVFSRFYRGHGDAVTQTRGAGIGLAIVTEYAASMSGTATVASSPSGGARFIVNFPAVNRPVPELNADLATASAGGLDVPVA